MDRPHIYFSRPIYESLPWVYLTLGVAAFVGSYLLRAVPALSVLAAVAGFAGVIGGAVILLRRRDYRDMRARYPQDAE